jgi:hypothetical protein
MSVATFLNVTPCSPRLVDKYQIFGGATKIERQPDIKIGYSSLTLQRLWCLNSNYGPRQGSYKFITPSKACKTVRRIKARVDALATRQEEVKRRILQMELNYNTKGLT